MFIFHSRPHYYIDLPVQSPVSNFIHVLPVCTAHCSDCQTPDSATADEALCNANGCDAGYGLTVDERCQGKRGYNNVV